MKDAYISSNNIKELLKYNNLATFAQLWELKTDWFEEPNYRRSGWSGVIKYALHSEDGKIIWVFIKRQENHNYKTIMHPIKGAPTFRREFININRMNAQHIPTLTTLYYAERHIENKDQAILITLSLEGYQSLEEFCRNEDNNAHPQRQAIMALTGQVTRQMHDAHFRHNCLYIKHFFLKHDEQSIDIRIIDLEKLKWLPLYYHIRWNDLSRIVRRGTLMTHEDKKNLLFSYYHSGKTNLEKSALAKNLNQLLEENRS